ncbi:histone deacetylase, partial [Nocardia beijingensis]|nr:histone deacetylase [Nocardia beijingensis]
KPSARYLGMLAGGLGESHGWPPDRILRYLSELPGVRDFWEPEELRGVVDGRSL